MRADRRRKNQGNQGWDARRRDGQMGGIEVSCPVGSKPKGKVIKAREWANVRRGRSVVCRNRCSLRVRASVQVEWE